MDELSNVLCPNITTSNQYFIIENFVYYIDNEYLY